MKFYTYINIKFKLLSNFVFIQSLAFGMWNVCIDLNPNVELGLEVLELKNIYAKIFEPIRFKNLKNGIKPMLGNSHFFVRTSHF